MYYSPVSDNGGVTGRKTLSIDPGFHLPSCWAEGGTLWKAEESLGDGARLMEEGPWGHAYEVTPTPGPRLDSSASFLQPCEPSMAFGSATRVMASTCCPFLVGLIAPKPVSSQNTFSTLHVDVCLVCMQVSYLPSFPSYFLCFFLFAYF